MRADPRHRQVGPRHTEFTTDDFSEIMALLGVFAMIGGRVACGSGVYG